MGEELLLRHLRELRGKTLYTLDYRRPFTIDEIKPDRINITTSKGNPRAITLQGTISAYKHLKTRGELTRTQIRDHYSDFNPAYIASILASIQNVEYTLRPIRLFIVKG